MKKTGKIKIGLAILTSIALVGLILGGVVSAKPPLDVIGSDDGKAKYVPDEIVVKFKGDEKPFRVIKIPKGKVGEKIKEYLERVDVEYAEPNFIVYALMVPNDEYYGYQWHMDNPEYGGIGMEEAWDISTGSGVTVAIIDTGIAYKDYGRQYTQATDLAETCFVAGYDFVNSDTHSNDDNGHGTHVAGTVAQSTNNNLGVAGVAFDACLMPVKVLNSNGAGTYADVADGIYFAVDNGAQVINLSLGGSESSTTLESAVAYAYNNGVTVVVAAGNNGESGGAIGYPAAYDDYVIAVGATQYDETLAYYSSYGPSLDLVAPGGNNNLDQNNDGYADGVLQQTFQRVGWRTTWAYYFMQGTSMASPHVAGTAALVISNGNATTPDEVRAVLQETAEDLGATGPDNTYGYGLVDAYAALGWSAVCEPTTEVCDGIDNDCDGLIDEDLTRSCGVTDVGACTFGTETCSAGAWVGCDAVLPTTETCNNIDDDCDGIVDQISQQCGTTDVGACEYGNQTCSVGLWGDCVGNVEPTTEVCDGIDNDCDGLTDEDLGTTTCGIGACQVTVDNCVGGAPQSCIPGTPTTEICNGIDDDCDGIIPSDEVDVDADGYMICGGDCDDSNAAINPGTIEICDEIDNNCNGEIDEGDVCEIPTVPCWSADYQYLYRNNGQAKKFCKCASGIYGYSRYSYTWGRKTVYYYIDSGDNENWEVTLRSSYLPVNSVTCTDGNVYPTNLDYYSQ